MYLEDPPELSTLAVALKHAKTFAQLDNAPYYVWNYAGEDDYFILPRTQKNTHYLVSDPVYLVEADGKQTRITT